RLSQCPLAAASLPRARVVSSARPGNGRPRPGALVVGAMVVATSLSTGAAGAVDFVVGSTADLPDVAPGDGVCDADAGPATVCTLRAAVQEANGLANDATASPPYDRIFVPGGTYTLTIPGRDEDVAATGDLDLTETV